MLEPLEEKKWKVLRAVIRDYILTALPVGSEKITRKYRLKISPATVRNIMGTLEELGFLEQPHPSSGRIPTDLGFRYYVDAIMDPRPLSKDVKEFILGRYQDAFLNVGAIMQETSRILSGISRYTGIVSAPRLGQAVLDRIDLVRMDPSRVLVVLISRTGVLYHRVIEEREGLSQDEWDRAANDLNPHVRGRTLAQVQERLRRQMETQQMQIHRILERLCNAVAGDPEPERTEIYIDGQSNILDYPEFSEDVRKMKKLFGAFEEKGKLLRVLDQAMEGEGIQVYIGVESQLDQMSECSLIFSRYDRGGIPLGTLGVIGPKRMDYSRVIPLVEFAAKAVGDKLEQMNV
jgi:heat-inducible transcriptional repressor